MTSVRVFLDQTSHTNNDDVKDEITTRQRSCTFKVAWSKGTSSKTSPKYTWKHITLKGITTTPRFWENIEKRYR